MDQPQVTIMIMQGQKTFQILGEPTVTERKASAEKQKEATVPEEDVELGDLSDGGR